VKIEPINPPELGAPRGYQNGLAVSGGRLVFVAGQVAFDGEHRIVGSGDFVAQIQQALSNFLCVVRAAGGGPEHVVQMTVYVTDKRAYLDHIGAVGAVWRGQMGRSWPTMALVEVSALVEDAAMVEIQGIAAVPDGGGM
jgi:enamine deaminase RidA (YjgF/YER057c/UK114 family)